MNKWNVKRYISRAIESNTYLIYNDKYSFVIDPSVSYDVIKKDIKNKLVAVLITHGHFDHFYEIESYMKLDNIKFYCHQNAIKKLENGLINFSRIYGIRLEIKTDDRFICVKEGKLNLTDDVIIDVIYTPGHSDCSLCYVFGDVIFTGDFIFKNSIGRTDLHTGNSVVMNESLKNFKSDKRLKQFENYVIYPGHEDATTLEDEFHYNPYLK